MVILFSQVKQITGGDFQAFSRDSEVTALVTDSRKAAPEGALFFAIRGKHHDGHDYIEKLYDEGVRQFIVERDLSDYGRLVDANILKVGSSVNALQSIASHHRAAFDIPVIGVTGSNGKTIVKEWLFQLLEPEFRIAKNPGSYNSQLGVPLSVWQLSAHHQMGIFEAGISRPGEMESLSAIIRPTIGIFTNIGSAHDEGFESQRQKVDEKLKLFNTARVLIYCKDHKALDQAITAAGIPGLSWGAASTAGIQVKKQSGSFNVSFKGISFNLAVPFSDRASLENCFHCVAVMLYLDYRAEVIQERIQMLQSVPMRLELKDGINQSQVIDDSYNNDLAGLRISLDFLSNQHQKKKKRVILSDILESGLSPQQLVEEIARHLKNSHVDSLVAVGPLLSLYKHSLPPGSLCYESTDQLIDQFDWDLIQNEIILVKGARIFEFERVISRLQRKVHGTVMEINLGALVNNLNYFRERLNPKTRIMAMVKAFAYGSGSAEIANLLQYHKVDYLGVAYADEGVDLRRNNITLPIMVMNPTEESFGTLLQHRLEPEIYSFGLLDALLGFLKGRACTIHIKLDTGMHRLGFEEQDLDALVARLADRPKVRIASIFSHLAGADEVAHDRFSEQQVASFIRCADRITAAIGYKPLYHILNSPGILRFPNYQMDMVRLGIGLYGIDPTEGGDANLKPVATLKTIVSQIKELPEGQTVGYGRRGKLPEKGRIATIAIGYADGFSRAFSNGKGTVLLNGQRAPVVGNVCMDMTMVDATGIDAQEGDEVIIFGPGLPIEELAKSIGTIPYEILTNTSDRVRRVFVAESI